MKYDIVILRRDRNSDKSYFESFEYTSQTPSDTVATALNYLNSTGIPDRKIEWECSCLQKKCGACAMVICGKPMLACDAVLSGLKGKSITIEPLKKFPIVCDLVVDRSILYDNLKKLKLWLKEDALQGDSYADLVFEASGCLQCGCCLEICPNFYSGGNFFGMSAVPITMRLLSESDKKDYKEIARLYSRHIFEGCGKSLSCKNVCPKGIDTQELLVNANALAVWKRKKK